MKTKTFYIIFLIIPLLFLSGCKKDYLDTTPEGVITPEEFYKTDEDATRSVMACYNMLQAWYGSPWNTLWMLKTFAADEIYSAGNKAGDQPAADEINQFRHGSNNAIVQGVYSMAYYVILRANNVIDKTLNESDYRKIVIAEAKAIRAYTYFELVTLWGTVPLVLHELKPGEYQQPNSTLSKLWEQIENDLKEAISTLPLKSNMKAAGMDLCRFSKGTAQALLGKAYLYQKKYADAAIQFQNVIDSKEYGLLPDYSQVLRKSSEFGIESLFEISYSSDRNNSGNTPNVWANPGRTALDNRIWQLCGPRGDQGFSPGNSGLNGGWGFAYPTFIIHEAYKKAGDSVRVHAAIMTESQLKALGGSYRNSEGNLPWGCTGLVRLKYGTWADETTPASIAAVEYNYGTNVRVIRYADVLLMAAEAYNQSGEDAKAYPLLALVRGRVSLGDNYTGKTGNALLEVIKTERQLELSFEGSRFQDLVRWGDAATVLANQCKTVPTGKFKENGERDFTPEISGAGFKAYNVLFPFPLNETKSNPLIKQNDGY